MIELRGICKNYGNTSVIEDLDLTIETGAVYGIVGHNGVGKTTLINMLAGVYKPDQGTITLDGEMIYEQIQVKEKVAYMPEQVHFLGCKTISQLAHYYKSMYGQFDTGLYDQLIELFELRKVKQLNTLSKGMKKQVAFIVTLCVKPQVLLLDELVDGIDPIKRRLVWSVLMKEVAERDLTVLIASHNIKELESVCSHMAILQEGRCVIEGDIESLREANEMSMEDMAIKWMGGMSDEAEKFIHQ